MTYKIDAKGKSVGRVATEAASVLMGKTSPAFQKHIAADVEVVIENASKATIAPSKLGEVHSKTYSGYPGGLRERTIGYTIEKKGYAEVFLRAISRMIPRNRLHKIRMKNLKVTE
ncbi:MAG: 50S ribosomal protein L13 [Parcubacteria group bacterium GW2011_GWC1_42_11]|uniref:50S ribosomal protein L13 n=1 Tax=Candidatus Nomurabacteria bacterium GW2011_GWC2_42_20 TaxID=1618756 RepID=A0A0G1CD81_9BACT|nr:MAG: 50S ribosomal protein L13 [Parcubacteria group bacterium GW2011_GWC1_42_11]KKS47588.1 MAG: 50S ribosomal protein L13 [Candidatus Nomurabacteria bacterium GW2011_GWC2_42_20]KKS58983.1 MAG: 50S ribosomal protein L13 [Candidatus Nomurabacteria bacterium GW2011_GWA2_42_41]KKT09547.1 MAG: 50S ribosomal protein L13 [Candidatus Nomurabacteria bacterium GW2011_GWB1_43_20]TAN35924.1 MAG: 50S ribosomal protein L13 [Patescibacteria group bacterium]HBH71500.1 50S ribosomal protein L13 [Candidatus 